MVLKYIISPALLLLVYLAFCELCVADYGGIPSLQKELHVDLSSLKLQLTDRFRIKSPTSPVIKHYKIGIPKPEFDKLNAILRAEYGQFTWQSGELIPEALTAYHLKMDDNICLELTTDTSFHSLLVYYPQSSELHVLIIQH